MEGLAALVPELALVAGALLVLFVDGDDDRRRWPAIVGAVVAAFAAGVALTIGAAGPVLGGLLMLDGTAVALRSVTAALTAIWLLWVSARGIGTARVAAATSLALLSLVGGMLIISARDLIVLFMALELATIPAYVLMGYARDDHRGLEGALKYFLLSMLTSLVMLYGLSFVYGISGTTSYAGLAGGAEGALRTIAFVLVLAGLLAKLSAAPFHFWAPDAYAGAPAASVAFVSTVPKVAATAALAHLLIALAPATPQASLVLIIAAVGSMLLGNLAAFPQDDTRRLMAYSGVAHTGYVLLALAVGESGVPAAVFYAVAYAVPSLAVMLLVAEEGARLDDLGGLVSRRPAAAYSAVVWLVSLIGIPPMVGFFGKLYLFTSAVEGGMVWPVVLAVVMSVVSAGYYFRILRRMFFVQHDGAALARDPRAAIALGLATVATLALGVFASPLLRLLGIAF